MNPFNNIVSRTCNPCAEIPLDTPPPNHITVKQLYQRDDIVGIVGRFLDADLGQEVADWINETMTVYKTVPYRYIDRCTGLTPIKAAYDAFYGVITGLIGANDAVALTLRWGDLIRTDGGKYS